MVMSLQPATQGFPQPRATTAALKIAVDMVNEGLVEKSNAVSGLVEPRHLDQLLHPQFKDVTGYKERVIAHGLPASPGETLQPSGQYSRGCEYRPRHPRPGH